MPSLKCNAKFEIWFTRKHLNMCDFRTYQKFISFFKFEKQKTYKFI